jgi:replicative DNA helicase
MNRPRYTTLPSIEYSKMPPNAVDLEEAVLGACLLEPVVINSVADILKSESFYKLEHQFIWEAIAHLSGLNLPVDIMTVTQELKRQGRLEAVGGAFYISKLTDRVGSSANAEYHARIVQQKFIARELIRVSEDLHSRAYDETEDPLALLDEAGSAIADVGNGSLTEQPMSNSELVAECVKGMELAQSSGNVIGIPTGLPDVDRVTGGFQEGHFDILAGRPGMAKTTKALAEIYDISVRQGKPSVFYSLEMTAKELMMKLICVEANLDSGRVKKGILSVEEWSVIHAAGAVLAKAPITIVDNLNSWHSIRMDATRRKSSNQCSFMVIDYIQLMRIDGWKGNKEGEVSEISVGIKSLAKSLNIPIRGIAQLSRAVETRGGTKKPMLSDLRGSGGLEQDADSVTFLYRPEYYGVEVSDETNLPTQGLCEVIIAKNRGGITGTVPVRVNLSTGRFSEWDATPFTAPAPPAEVEVKWSPMPRSREFDDTDENPF